MTLVTRPLPGLFGGVSQKIPAMRHPTHCEQQDNGLATLVDGLYKRPGSRHVALLDLFGPGTSSVQASYGKAYGHVIDKADAGRYMLVLVNGNLMLYDMADGEAQMVTFPTGLAYLNTPDPEGDFRCVTVADYTFVINKSKTVALQTATDPANDTSVVYVHVRTAVPDCLYRVTVDGVTASITSPDAPTNASIAAQLVTALTTALTGYTVSTLQDTNIIRIAKAATVLTCSVYDGWANTALQCISNGVPKFADLPPTFITGYTITIQGTADSVKDRYYVRWDGTRWVEAKQPTLADTFDAATMPHQLRPDGSGGWVFEQATWDTRKVGDEDTAPAPSFVGNTLRDVFFFRNRLGLLAADGLIMSRAGDYFSFWPKSATQVLDSDPIDLSSTAAEVETLDWAVVYNKALVVWAASKQQFRLEGGDVLSPNTAHLLPSTTFESYLGAKPALLGNRILFSSTAGGYSQLNMYRVALDRVTDTTDDLTEHVPRYVPAEPRGIEASTVAKMAAVIPRGVSSELAIFKYEMDKDEQMSQQAWCKFQLATGGEPTRVIKAYWVSRKLYLLTHRVVTGDIVAGGRFFLEFIDFEENAFDQDAAIALRLDQRVMAEFVELQEGVDPMSTVRLPYAADITGLKFLLCSPGVEPIEMAGTAGIVNAATMTTELTLPGDLSDSTVWAGRTYLFRYQFTEVFFRDKDGVPVMGAKLKLKKMLLKYEKTGWFKALVQPLLRSLYTYPMSGRTIGMPGQGASQLGLSSGVFSVPVDTKAEGVTIAIESDSYLPCSIPYAEWVGDIEMKASR